MSDNKPKPIAYVLLDTPADWLGLNMTDKALLQHLVGHLNARRNGTEVWPGNERLAALVGCSIDTVSRAKRRLHDAQMIKISRDRGKSDLCTINVDLIRSLADPARRAGAGAGAGGQAVDNFSDPPQIAGGSEADPPQNAGSTLRKLRRHPPQIAEGTAKEQPMEQPSQKTSSFGCSHISEIVVPPGQQQLVTFGVIDDRDRASRSNEQPKTEKEKTDIDERATPTRAAGHSP